MPDDAARTQAAVAQARPADVPTVLGADGAEVNWTKVMLGYGGMVIGQFMALLDIQIVASSLTQIQAGIGATNDEISWIQTIYLLAEVVTMPLSAYLTKMWGTRTLYVVATLGFIVTSIATGLSTSVDMMIITRMLQGLTAGAMVPPVFATAMTVFPPEKRVTVNVVMGLVVTLAPTIGPTLGGWLTDQLSWRWLFFINVPVGLLSLTLVGRYGGFDKGDPKLGKGIDWAGLALMSTFLLSLQYVLEEGAKNRWLQDDGILWLSVLSVLSGIAFIWRQLAYRQPIVSLRPFLDRHFTLGIVMIATVGMSMFGGTYAVPVFLGQVRGFSSTEVGESMLIVGATMFLTAPLAGRIVRAIPIRLSLAIGLGLSAFGFSRGMYITDQWGIGEFAGMQAMRGFGNMLAMVAAQQMSVSTIPVQLMKDASGLLNLIRNVAGAIGMATVSTMLTQQTAAHYDDLANAASVANPVSQDALAGLTALMTQGGMADPDGGAHKALGFLLRREAAVLSFGDVFLTLSVVCWLSAALALVAAPSRPVTIAGLSKEGAH